MVTFMYALAKCNILIKPKWMKERVEIRTRFSYIMRQTLLDPSSSLVSKIEFQKSMDIIK